MGKYQELDSENHGVSECMVVFCFFGLLYVNADNFQISSSFLIA